MLIALTRAVPPSIAQCELTHLARAPIDVDLAARQHEEYEAALRAAGCTVVRLRPEPDLPDSVFVEDAAVVFSELAVITRPGAASRRRETESVAEALAAHRPIQRIEAPGTLDGGDVLVAGRSVFVGAGGRSNDEGIRQLAVILAPFGYRVRRRLHDGVPASQVGRHPRLGVVRARQSGLGRSRRHSRRSRRCRFTGMSRSPRMPFASASDSSTAPLTPETRARLERRGFAVTPVDLGELAKAEGALTCCSLLIR